MGGGREGREEWEGREEREGRAGGVRAPIGGCNIVLLNGGEGGQGGKGGEGGKGGGGAGTYWRL